MRRTLTSAVALAVGLGGVALAAPGQAAAAPAAVTAAVTTTATMATATTATATIATAPSLATAPAALTAPPIRWHGCADADLNAAGAQCGSLEVPLDYARPYGTKIRLAMSRVRHTVPAAQYQGIMLTNPGGPGGAGVNLSTLGRYVPKNAGAAYDWIGFDPRGVGRSSRALSCRPGYFAPDRPDYVATTRALETTWLRRSASYASACKASDARLLSHVRTIDTVRDMEMIRRSSGVPKISFYGFSYGTYLAQVYATKFPTRVHRMVLDGTVDPRRVWYKANLDQDVAFERNINIWFSWLSRYNSVYRLGTTRSAVAKRWYAEQNRLRRAPAGGVVGPDEWNDIFVQAAYYESTWTELADVFVAWARQRDENAIIDAYAATDNPGDDNGFAMYNATQCTDATWPRSWSTWRSDARRTYEKAPFLTWNNTWYNAPCLTWPVRAGTPVPVDGRRAPAVLMISQTLDAATPYRGSLEVRRRFPRARLIAEPGGTTHAGSLYGNACVDNRIADYLLSGRLDPRRAGGGADVFCRRAPRPVPGAVTVMDSSRHGVGAGPSREELRRLTPTL